MAVHYEVPTNIMTWPLYTNNFTITSPQTLSTIPAVVQLDMKVIRDKKLAMPLIKFRKQRYVNGIIYFYHIIL